MIKDTPAADPSMHAEANANADPLARARALFERDRAPEAAALLRDALRREPAREDLAGLLVRVLQSQGRVSAAAEVLLAVCAANEFAADLSLRCAKTAEQCDRHGIAARICEQALERTPSAPDLLVQAGHVAREMGDFDKARARYLAAIEAGVDLDRRQVLGALANIRRYSDPADPDIRRFEAQFRDHAFSVRSRASAGFALAKARNDLGDYAAAAAALREANAMVHGEQPWDRPAWHAFMAAQARAVVAAATGAPARDFVPVFIVGLPRTGTTLTATLLARAAGARDRGELRALRYIADRLIGGRHLDSPAALAEAGGLYRTLAVQDDAPARWYLDQDPMNFRYLHLVAAMFPQARVIHLRRDRRDTALSLWSQDFAHPDMAFAYDFDDMAAFMADHDMLMAHWMKALRIPIHELDYETLVTDTDAALAGLCDFIGASRRETGEADAAPVQSASVWQARQPVYSSSVGRWRHYAPHVPELERFG